MYYLLSFKKIYKLTKKFTGPGLDGGSYILDFEKEEKNISWPKLVHTEMAQS